MWMVLDVKGKLASSPGFHETVTNFDDSYRQSTVLAVEQVAHRVPAGGVGLLVRLPSVGSVRVFIGGLLLAARWATVGEAGFARLQFEFFSASNAGFDGIAHDNSLTL